MPGKPQPLVNNQAIAKPDGTPTDYFIRWAQTRQIDIANGITAEEAQQLIVDYLGEHPLQSGVGISLTPSGSIADDVTIALNAVLGNLNDVDMSVAPTNGQVLVYDDVSMTWKPADQSGGGYVLIAQVKLIAPGAVTFAAIPDTFKDLIVVYRVGVTTINAATRLHVQLNGDTGNNYDWNYWNRYGNVGPTYGVNAMACDEIPPQKTAGTLDGTKTGSFEIIDYASAGTPKMIHGSSSMRYVTSGGFTPDLFSGQHSGDWQSAAPITSVTITASANQLDIGSTISLYGRA